MKVGEHKKYIRCGVCNEDLPVTRKYFRRKNIGVNTKETYDIICKSCRDLEQYEKNWRDGLLVCRICKIFLPEKNFSVNNALKYRGRESVCRSCKSKNSAIKRSQRIGEFAIERIITERFLSAKSRAIKSNIEFTISKEFILSLLKRQDYKCKITGILLTYIMGKGRIPTNLSIDQIEPSLGYTESNIQIVCMAINQMKSDMTMKQLLFFCEKVLNNYNGQD